MQLKISTTLLIAEIVAKVFILKCKYLLRGLELVRGIITSTRLEAFYYNTSSITKDIGYLILSYKELIKVKLKFLLHIELLILIIRTLILIKVL